MQKFELSEEMLENVTGGINKNTALKIGSAAGAVAALSVVGICTAICISKKKENKEEKKEKEEEKEECTIEFIKIAPRITYLIEEF